ncbi:DMT family transporter [Candidatus Woesearchaeota archaeon]|nr:DMT family transporter [Candidatus Woesearchaeota archaeon]
MNQKKGMIFIILAALMFGSYGIWSRLIGDSFGVFYQGWTRGLIIALILLPILLWKKQIIPIEKKDWGWIALFLTFTSLTQAPLFYAFNHMDIGSATLLFFVSMLLTMYLVGILFLGEKLTKIKVISFLLAACGMYVVFSFSLIVFSLLAVILAMVNGIASGGELSFSKKLSGDYSPLYISWLSWIIICVSNAPLSFILRETQYLPSFELVWLYALGYVMVSILGFWLMIKGLKYTEASIGGLIGLLEIIVSLFLGILIFKETITTKIVLGATLIILAAALPNIYELFQKKAKK